MRIWNERSMWGIMTEYQICRRCPVWHYENCGTCFGFGVRVNSSGLNVPIRACEAIHVGNSSDQPLPEWIRCPECGSTPQGLSDIGTLTIGSADIGAIGPESSFTVEQKY